MNYNDIGNLVVDQQGLQEFQAAAEASSFGWGFWAVVILLLIAGLFILAAFQKSKQSDKSDKDTEQD